MVRVLSTSLLLLVFVAAEVTFASACQIFFTKDVRTVEDFKGVAEFALENHAYHGKLDAKVLSHFVQELPTYMDSFKIIFEESDINKFQDADAKMVRRIESDLNQNKIKRMEVLYARYQMRVQQIRSEILDSDLHKNDIINMAQSSRKLEIPSWGRTHNDVIQNVKVFMAMQMKQFLSLDQSVDHAYILASRTLNRYLSQWEQKQSGASPIIELMSRSLVSGLDPFSNFKSREELLEDALAPARRFFAGFAMTEAVEGVLVTEVIEDSPAQKAGLLKGDVIVKVHGEATHNLPIKEFMHRLNGHPHPQVKMRIRRSQQEFDVLVMRALPAGRALKVKSQTVVSRTGQLVSVKLEDFDSGASQIFLTALHEAFKKGPVSGVVLDLRGNPGGYVHEALQILRVFLSKQPVLIYQNKGETESISLGGGHPTLDIPLVVLVNEGSASASELVSGALQSEKRAIVMGVSTFGKGTAHSVIVGDYGGMQLTQNFFHFTNGESPQLKGVKPDIRIQRKENRRRSASDLEYALPEQQIPALDRSEFADLQREKLFDSIKQALTKRSEQRQQSGLEQLDKSIDPELSEAFRVLSEWAELIQVLTPAVPKAS